MLVVDEQAALVRRDELARAILAELDAALALGPEHNRLAVDQPDLVLRLLLDRVEGAVVVDVAVLVDLDERRALVHGRPAEDLGQVLLVGVDRAPYESRLGAQRDR